MDRIDQILEMFGLEKVAGVRELLRIWNVNASGNLSRGTDFELYSTPEKSTLAIVSLGYIYTVDTGRGPTRKRGGGGFTINSIREWIVNKRIQVPNTFRNIDSFAWAIYTVINRSGTKLFRDGGRTILMDEINKDIDKLGIEILEVVASETFEVIKQWA